jgi:hypothetical protein
MPLRISLTQDAETSPGHLVLNQRWESIGVGSPLFVVAVTSAILLPGIPDHRW